MNIRGFGKAFKLSLRALTLNFIALHSACVFANDIDYVSLTNEALKTAFLTGDYPFAYQIATDNLIEMEGDAVFDFYYGLTSLRLRKYEEARFTFERLVYSNPDQPRYRLEYGLALFNQQQYEQSAEQFNTVLRTDPPEQVKQNINQYLSFIKQYQRRANKHWSLSLDIGSGYDSNINSATDLDAIGLIRINEDSQSTESGFASLSANLNYTLTLNQKSDVDFNLVTHHKKNDHTSDYDIDIVRLKTAWGYQFSKRQSIKLGPSYLEVLLDGQRYGQDSGVFVEWMKYAKSFIIQSQLGYRIKDYWDSPELEAEQSDTSLSLLFPHGRLTHSVFLYASFDTPRSEGQKSALKNLANLGYRLNHRLNKQWSWQAVLSSTHTEYLADNSFFGLTRRDDSYHISLGLARVLTRHLRADVELSSAVNSSNLQLYDYDRNKVQFSLQLDY